MTCSSAHSDKGDALLQGTMSLSQVLNASLDGGSLQGKINSVRQFSSEISQEAAHGTMSFESDTEYLFEWWITA